jgi:hypothetical protein
MDIGTMFEHRESVMVMANSRASVAVHSEVPRGAKSIYDQFKSRARFPLAGID